MSKLKAECVTYDNGIQRRLLQLKENSDGTIIIKNNSGLQVGLPPNAKKIAIHRYSVHPSLNSTLPYSTFVRHLEFEDRSFFPPTYLTTNAIKSKRGFTNLFTMRYSDLKSQKNDLNKIKPGFDVVDLGGFNSEKECFYLSIFVGHKDTAFNTESRAFKKTELLSKHIKLVILTGLIPVPAIPFAFIFDRITHGDTIFGPDFKGAPHQFESSTIDECLSYYEYCVGMLQENYYDSLDQWKAHIDETLALLEGNNK